MNSIIKNRITFSFTKLKIKVILSGCLNSWYLKYRFSRKKKGERIEKFDIIWNLIFDTREIYYMVTKHVTTWWNNLLRVFTCNHIVSM